MADDNTIEQATTWTIAVRIKPRSRYFLRVADFAGTWHEARQLAADVTIARPDLALVYYVPTLAAERAGYVATEDVGNVMNETGGRTAVRDNGLTLADLGAAGWSPRCTDRGYWCPVHHATVKATRGADDGARCPLPVPPAPREPFGVIARFRGTWTEADRRLDALRTAGYAGWVDQDGFAVDEPAPGTARGRRLDIWPDGRGGLTGTRRPLCDLVNDEAAHIAQVEAETDRAIDAERDPRVDVLDEALTAAARRVATLRTLADLDALAVTR